MKNKNIARAGIALAAAAAMTLPIAPLASANGPTVTHLSQSASAPGDAVMAGWATELLDGKSLGLVLADEYLTDDGYVRGELTAVSDDDENLKAEFDEPTRTVTITAEGAAVGDKVTVSFAYTKEVSPAVPGEGGEPGTPAVIETISVDHTVTVVEKMSVIHKDFTYADITPVKANIETTFAPDYETPTGTTFKLDEDVEGVSIDENTGDLTVKADLLQANRDLNVVVIVTFPDGTSLDNVALTIPVDEAYNVIHDDLAYSTGGTYRANVPGEKSLTGAVPPEGTTFKLDKDVKGVSIDENTGKLTLNFVTEQANSTVEAVVVATFPDKSTKEITASITVAELLSITHAETPAAYIGKVIQGYGSQKITEPVHELPAGTIYMFEPGEVPEGAKISVDPNTGGIRVLSATTRDQDFAVTVNVVFVDGSTRSIDATVRYNSAHAERHKPTYATQNVKDGIPSKFATVFGSGSIPGEVTIGDVTVDSDLDFDIIEADGGVVEVEEGRSSLIYNPTNGDIDIQVPFGTPEGTKIRVIVPFKFQDESTATGVIETEVVQNDAAAYDPVYPDTGAVTGAAAKTVYLTGSELPEQTTFALDDAPAEWNVSLDEDTGALTFTTPKGAAVGDVATVTVTVNYPDGTSEKVTQTIEVMDSFAEATAPEYLNTWIKPGETKVIENTGEEFPEGVTVTADQSTVTDGWVVEVDEEHAIHVTAPEDAEIGDELTFDVNIRYTDKSGEVQNVSVTVSLYDPDLIQRTIRRTIVIEVPPTQDEINAAIQERDEQIAAEEAANGGAVGTILANTGADVGTLALAATIAAALAGAGFFANRRRKN